MHATKMFLSGMMICSALFVSGAIVLAFLSAPTERTEVTWDDVLIVRANGYRAEDFTFYSVWDNIVSFNVLNGTIKSCEPLTEAQYLDWQAGLYTPNWTETNHGAYEYDGTHLSPPLIGPVYGRYFLFYNQDQYDKAIRWDITSHWTEPNTTNLTIGVGLIATGLMVGSGLVLIYMLKPSSHLSVSNPS